MLRTVPKKLSTENGFTLIELLLAMTLFSFGLLVIVTGFLALLGYYQNGVENRIVQTTARNAIDAINLAGRTSKWMAYNTNTVCISSAAGNTIFYYDPPPGSSRIWRGGWDSTKGCVASAASAAQPITSPDAPVVALQAEPSGGFTFFNLINGIPIQQCTINLDCSANLGYQAFNMRVAVIVTSQPSNVAPNGIGCNPSAPAFCVTVNLATDINSSENKFR